MILFILLVANFLLFLKTLLDFLSNGRKLGLLFVSQLLQEIADFIDPDVVVFLVLLALKGLYLFLHLVGLEVVLLFGQVLLYPAQIHELGGVFLSVAEGFLDLLLKLDGLGLMLADEVLLDGLGLLLVLGHFLIPIIIELCDFLDMCHLYLFLLLLVLS